MKRLIIHLGVHKTGTTALQHFLYANRQIIAEKYLIHYPVISTDQFYYQHNAIADYLKNDQIDSVKAFFKEAISVSDTVLLSSESFSGGSKVPFNLAFVKDIFEEIEIIIYLRRQDLWLESIYQQLIKSGKLSALDTFDVWIKKYFTMRKGMYSCDWSILLNFWSNIFGKEKIIVRPYEKTQLRNKDIIEDFLAQIQISNKRADFDFKLKFENTSLNKHATDFLRLFNDAKDFDRWKQLLNLWIKNPDRDTGEVYLTYDERLSIIERYKESNQQVASTYLIENSSLFTDPIPEKENYPKVFTGLNQSMLLLDRRLLDNYLNLVNNY